MRTAMNSCSVSCVLFLACYSALLEIIHANSDFERAKLNLTEESSSPLTAQLRSKIKNLNLDSYYTSDKQLDQYIENSGFNVERAANLLTETAQWRKSSGANNILDTAPSSFLTENFPYEITGYTDEGNPVFYLPIGKWNYQAVFKAGLGSEIYKYYIRMLEVIRKSTTGRVNPKTGEPVDQVIIIENIDGYSIRSLLTVRNNQFITILRYLRNIDRYYPFLVKNYVALNVVSAFIYLGWPLLRNATPRLRKVFHPYHRFSRRGYEELFHIVPRRLIPIELGGTYISLVSRN